MPCSICNRHRQLINKKHGTKRNRIRPNNNHTRNHNNLHIRNLVHHNNHIHPNHIPNNTYRIHNAHNNNNNNIHNTRRIHNNNIHNNYIHNNRIHNSHLGRKHQLIRHRHRPQMRRSHHPCNKAQAKCKVDQDLYMGPWAMEALRVQLPTMRTNYKLLHASKTCLVYNRIRSN